MRLIKHFLNCYGISETRKIGEWISNWFSNLWKTIKNKLMFWKKDNEPEKPIENASNDDELLKKQGKYSQLWRIQNEKSDCIAAPN